MSVNEPATTYIRVRFQKAFRILIAWVLLAISGLVSAGYEEVIYYHNDVLGSPVIASDANGDIKWEEDYDPFGKRREHQSREMENGEPVENLWDETAWFTGKQEEARLGITNMGARWYDPSIGRFMAPDPVGFVEGNPMSFNRYMYVNNNPYRYNDPDGEFLNFVLGGVKAAIENTLIQTAEIALGVRDSFSYKELAQEAAIGTVTSGLSSIKNAGKLAALGAKLSKRKGLGKQCFVEGTLVHTKDGLKPIEEIKVGDFVKSKDEVTEEANWKLVAKLFRNYDQEILNVHLAGDQGEKQLLGVTQEHPFGLLEKDGWELDLCVKVID